MEFDRTIRERGFRRWYERQLVEGHAWLVTGFLSLVMMGVVLEVVEYRESVSGTLALLVVGGGGAALCLYAWRRFSRQLGLAEHVAAQATCPSCRAYAKLSFVRGARDAGRASGRAVDVRCRACATEWTIG